MKHMKKIYSLLFVPALLSLASCMEIDNFDEPDAHISGTIIDSTTGEPYQTDMDNVHIRIWEKSYSLNPTPQDLSVKEDGTYNNTKIFRGTYDMVPNDGPWWPCDTIRGVAIGNHKVQDFTVTPYLKIKDFNCAYEKDEKGEYWIVMSGRLFAPIVDPSMPNVQEVRPFLSINSHCGQGNRLDYYYKDEYRYNLRRAWSRLGDDNGEGNEIYEFRLPVKKGYTYWCRMGVNMMDLYNKFNYSQIVKLEIPEE